MCNNKENLVLINRTFMVYAYEILCDAVSHRTVTASSIAYYFSLSFIIIRDVRINTTTVRLA